VQQPKKKQIPFGNDKSKGVGMDVTLRDYRAGDLEVMYALDVVCFEPPFRFSKLAMRRFAEARGSIAVLAEAPEELAGFCIVQVEGGKSGRQGYVVTLDVAPEWRRRGLAGRLMADAEAKAAQAGTTRMALHVFAGNVGAVRFYEGIGYARTGIEQGFYGRGLDAVVYFKPIR
jgi:ribosomal-protein-alanine N-acetyltransferase